MSKRLVLYVVFLILSGGLILESAYHTRTDPFWLFVGWHFAAGLALITVLYSRRLAKILARVCWATVAVGEAIVAWYWITQFPIAVIGPRYFRSPQDWWIATARCPDCTYVDISELATLVLLVIVVVLGLHRLNAYLLAKEQPGGKGSSLRPVV